MSEEGLGRGRRLKKKEGADLIEIVGKITPRSDRVDDELTRIIDEQIRLKAKEYKLKMLDKMSKQLDKELIELDEILRNANPKETIKIDSGKNHFDIDVRIATELAKLPEEDRKKVIETYAMLRAAERSAANPNMMLPLLIGFAREHKDTSKEELFQWGKLQLETMKTAWDMAKTGEKPKSGDEPLKVFLDMFKQILEQERENRKLEFEMMMKKMEEMRQPSLIEAILFDEKTRNALKEIGLFNPPREHGMDPRLQLQLKQLEMQHQKELKRMEMEFQLKLEELKAEQAKLAAMLQGIRAIGSAAADALTNSIVFSENPATSGNAGAQSSLTEGGQQAQVVTLPCPQCGSSITFPSTAKTVKCPNCNTMFQVREKKE